MAGRWCAAALVAAIVLSGCSGGGGDGPAALDPATLGRLIVDPDDEVCVALQATTEVPAYGAESMPRTEFARVLDQRAAAWDRVARVDPDRFGEFAAVVPVINRLLVDEWGDDGRDLLARSDEERMRALYLVLNDAQRRGETVVTARHYDELRRETWRATDDCAANTLDLQVLIEGDESPPSGFILYRDSPEDVSGLTATSSDGASTWDVGRADGRSLGEFRVSPDGTQVLAEAFSRRDGASRFVVAGVADLRSGAADPWHTIGPDDDQWGQGRWSRDGRRIIGTYGPYTARRLAVLEIDTGRATDLGEPAGWSSAFAPGAVFDESVIVSGGPTGGVLQRVDLASGTWVEILDLPACAIADTIEIDDERLFLSVSCVDQRTSGIYSVGSDGSDLRAVFTGVNSSIPRRSADGEWMAMNLQDPLAERLDPRPWIARVDGTQARQLSDGWAGYSTWIDA